MEGTIHESNFIDIKLTYNQLETCHKNNSNGDAAICPNPNSVEFCDLYFTTEY